jgi:hypothetical protein
MGRNPILIPSRDRNHVRKHDRSRDPRAKTQD